MQFKARLRNMLSFREEAVCMTGCPVNTDSGMYVQQIAKGEYEAGYLTARSPNPFASSCARVCAAPCEDQCRRGKVDEPVSIRSLKKFLTERYGVESQRSRTMAQLFDGVSPKSHTHAMHVAPLAKTATKTGKKVAVIGAGPAGLAAAHDLAILGYRVTVFEESPHTGGMMRLGIPSYRLPDEVLDLEVEQIRSMGVEIQLNTRISAESGIQRLREQGYEAIFIAVGVVKGRLTNIEGGDLQGVMPALDFLVKSNQGISSDIGKRVVVIGGGLVAMDAARDARRQMLEKDETAQLIVAMDAAMDARRQILSHADHEGYEVHVASLESMAEMPAALSTSGRQELEETLDENINFHPSWGPHRILGENGKVTGIELKKVVQVFDADGRFHPIFSEDEKKVIRCDSVIFAVGQAADLSFLKDADGVEITPRGTLKIDAHLMTTAPGIFAGGDVAFGPRNLIDAVSNGKKAALAIDTFLTGKARTVEFNVKIDVHHTPAYRMPAEYEKKARTTPPVAPPEKRIGKQEIELSFTEEEARSQASRCLTCHTSPIYNSEECIICGRCTDICPQKCLTFVPYSSLTIENENEKNPGSDLLRYLRAQPDDDLTVMLKDDTACIRCGLCATRCPTGAMTMETILVNEVPHIA